MNLRAGPALGPASPALLRALVFALVAGAATLLWPATSLAAQPSTALDPLLTPAERQWLAEHDAVSVAFDGHFPPYSFRGDAGELEGFAVEIFALLAERTGLRLDAWQGGDDSWSVLYQAAQEGRVDVVATMVQRPDRLEWFRFTQPYVHKSLMVMARKDDPRIHSRQNLADKRVALVRDYQYTARILRDFPSIEPLYVETMVDALNAVSTHQADAAITFLGGGDFLRTRHLMTNLEFVAVYDRDSSAESIAVQRDQPELLAILDKALQTVSAAERLELEGRWLPRLDPLAEDSSSVSLTEAEERWIADHPVVRVGVDPEFHPYEFIDEDGVHRGMSADLLAMLEERTGLNLELVEGLSWEQVIERAERREIDLLPAVGMTEERKGYLLFSSPWVEFHRVIITRSEMPFLTGLQDLRGMRVAVQESSSHQGFLSAGTGIEATAYPTLEQAILAVADGRSDALVGNLASSAYWIRKLTLTNLKVAGAASSQSQGLHMAVRDDWPELAGILQKGLASITPAERAALTQRWVVLEFDPQKDYGPVLRVTAISALSLVVAFLWIRQSRQRSRLLEQARVQAEQSRKRAEDANSDLRALREQLEQRVAARTIELRDSEQRFRRAQKMEALGTLVGGIAHDFNNLLSGIMGTLFLAREGGPERIEEELDKGEVLCMRGAEMIGQLLAFARQESVAKEVVRLGELVVEAHRLVEPAVPSNIVFEVDPGQDELWVKASRTLLQQALFNLVINARDALVGVSEPRIELRLSGGGAAHIEVRDNGVGIPADQLDKLFDPFFSTKAPGKGTGLGLAMVYGSVLDHGGTIEVESEPGAGSCFRVTLPTVPAPEQRDADQGQSRTLRGRGEVLLLADDDAELREIHTVILDSLGYQVVSVGDGQAAVDAVAEQPQHFSLAVLDQVMPGRTGTAAARRIRALSPATRIVLLTGYGASHADIDDSIIDIVLSKPVSIAELSRVLRQQLDRAPTEDEQPQS